MFYRLIGCFIFVVCLAVSALLGTPPIRQEDRAPAWSTSMPVLSGELAAAWDDCKKAAAGGHLDQVMQSAEKLSGLMSKLKPFEREQLRPLFRDALAHCQKVGKDLPQDAVQRMFLCYLNVRIGASLLRPGDLPDLPTRLEEKTLEIYWADRQAKEEVRRQTLAADVEMIEQAVEVKQADLTKAAASLVTDGMGMLFFLAGAADDPKALADRIMRLRPKIIALGESEKEQAAALARRAQAAEGIVKVMVARAEQKKGCVELFEKQGLHYLETVKGRKLSPDRVRIFGIGLWSDTHGQVDFLVRYKEGDKTIFSTGWVNIYRKDGGWEITDGDIRPPTE